MFKIFITTHGFLLFFGLLLLLYYAKTGYKINQEVFKSDKKARVPKPVRFYAFFLLSWIIGISAYFFIQLFR